MKISMLISRSRELSSTFLMLFTVANKLMFIDEIFLSYQTFVYNAKSDHGLSSAILQAVCKGAPFTLKQKIKHGVFGMTTLKELNVVAMIFNKPDFAVHVLRDEQNKLMHRTKSTPKKLEDTKTARQM